MFEKGDDITYISGITGKGIKSHYTKILDINSEDQTISLENAMIVKFVKKFEPGSIWLLYRNIKTGASVLIKEKF